MINHQIKTLRSILGLTQAAFSERIGIGTTSVSMLESGKNNPSEQTIRAICSEFGVRREWLETGEGEMYAPVTDDDAIGIIGQRMLDDPDHTGRLFRAVAAMGEDSWRILVAKVDELFAAYVAADSSTDDHEQ